jgi:hypothetical protein
MLERCAREGKSIRLAVDIISQLQKCSTAIESQRIKARELLHRDDVLRLCGRLVEIIHAEIMLLHLPEEIRVELADRIVGRIKMQAQEDALLLEGETQ